MKNVKTALIALALAFTTQAQATSLHPDTFKNGPVIHPGPVQKLHDDANKLARVLLEVPEAVKEFSERFDIVIFSSTYQKIDPKVVVYTLSGGILMGDVITGRRTLKITEKRVPSGHPFQPWAYVYETEVSTEMF